MRYTVLISGFYEVSCKVLHSRPTGKFECIKNPKHKWWDVFEWLEPKMAMKEIYETYESDGGVIIRRFSAGEVVDTKTLRRLK